MKIIAFILLAVVIWPATMYAMVSFDADKNVSYVAIALAEIVKALKPTQLTILAAPPHQMAAPTNAAVEYQHGDNLQQDVDDFVHQLHKLYFKTIIYYDVELFFQFIEASLQGSIESVNLIFCQPYDLSARIQERKLSHRLSLFIFYWGAKYPPKAYDVQFEEPIRAVVITRPRKRAFRIYYNQAVPDGGSNLCLVNWFDGDNLGLQRVPLLPNAASVYSNFKGRVFRVPVFHSPPWFWVNYNNDSIANITTAEGVEEQDYFSVSDDVDSVEQEYTELNVTGGRDHRLLKLLAERMNFQFIYIDAPGRTQGSLRVDADGEINETFTGAIGLLQNGQADFLLGDVGLSWERRKAVEFSFFTLADSGAFATHAPRRLNEAFAIVRPFKMDVWPYLILTVLFSGPIFYGIIAMPYRWQRRRNAREQQYQDVERMGELRFYMAYIKEITIGDAYVHQQQRILHRAAIEDDSTQMPRHLFDRCIWFTVQLFLKQSCQELYHGYRAKFLMIVYWIAATYVLADVYSAQLTSQFARPPHEAPINTLYRLQRAMLDDGYQLFVEKESSSLEMLENGTEIFRHLYALMKQQQQQQAHDDPDRFLIDSVEAGIKLIADGLENKAVLAGRETLFFNMQQYRSKTFQLSHKLYTRYSAVAVQIGCPFLDSLNAVLIHLFEGGILDKMTNAEYATQSRMIGKELSEKNGPGEEDHPTVTAVANDENNVSSNNDSNENINNNNNNGKTSSANGSNGSSTANGDTQHPKSREGSGRQSIQPLNLRMLQGAFIGLLFGYGTACAIFCAELLCVRWDWTCNWNWIAACAALGPRERYQHFQRRAWRLARIALRRFMR